MAPRFVIAGREPGLLAIWREVFADCPEVAVISMPPRDFRERGGIDAIVLLSSFAHERYGGTQIRGVAQVLDTSRDRQGPPWAVTTVPRPIHFEPIDQDQSVLLPEEPMSEVAETVDTFSKVFRAVHEFNRSRTEGRIGVLGLHLELVDSPQGDPRQEAEAVKAALRATQS